MKNKTSTVKDIFLDGSARSKTAEAARAEIEDKTIMDASHFLLKHAEMFIVSACASVGAPPFSDAVDDLFNILKKNANNRLEMAKKMGGGEY